jgi:hypothetical protein
MDDLSQVLVDIEEHDNGDIVLIYASREDAEMMVWTRCNVAHWIRENGGGWLDERTDN